MTIMQSSDFAGQEFPEKSSKLGPFAVPEEWLASCAIPTA